MAKFNFSKRDLMMPGVLVIFFFIFYLIYEDIKDRTINEFNHEQFILASTASQGMTTFFDEHQSMLTFLSGLDDIIDLTETGKELLANYYNTHESPIEAITRIDADGIIIYTYPQKESVIGNDISYQKHVNQAITTQEPVLSDVFMAAQGYLAIALNVPVFKEEVYTGSLTLLIPIDKLGKLFLGDIQDSKTGNVWLVSENGIEIYCPYTEHIGKPMLANMNNDAPARELTEKIKLTSSGIVKGIHTKTTDLTNKKLNGQNITFFRTPLEKTYWTILISYQEKDIYDAIASFRNRLILVFFLLFITISYFFYSLTRVSKLLKIEEALIKAKEKAEESDRLKTAFLQNMSHEIRTPMNAIMGFSSLLGECYNNKSQLDVYSEIISQRGKDLLAIIDDILNISKIESGQLAVNKEDCNLNDFFADLNTYFYGYQKRIRKQQLAFNLEVPDDPALKTISTDKVKLRQIFVNLLSNAFKYTNIGKIEGGCKFDENRKLVFYVSDTGFGIPANKQEVIFERFAQLDQPASKVIAGTGLGLSIAKGLVELLGGKIWLESEMEKGTTFYFSIPVDIADTASPVQAPAKQDLAYEFTAKTVLVVEDDNDNYEFIKIVLAKTGLKIIHTKFGKEAVRLAISQSPDLVLMDIRLPDIDGYEATRQILLQNPGLSIIAQTAYAGQDDKLKAFDAGCIDYISKPLDRKLLLDMIKKHISNS